jgi:hypothetical protein
MGSDGCALFAAESMALSRFLAECLSGMGDVDEYIERDNWVGNKHVHQDCVPMS